jgi:hypothetical protein
MDSSLSRSHLHRDYWSEETGQVSSSLRSQSIRRNGRDDGVHLEADEAGCELNEAFGITFRVPILDIDVLSVDPSEFTQTQQKCLTPGRSSEMAVWQKKFYPWNLDRFLRALRRAKQARATSPKREWRGASCTAPHRRGWNFPPPTRPGNG